jgi:hypothetical protein
VQKLLANTIISTETLFSFAIRYTLYAIRYTLYAIRYTLKQTQNFIEQTGQATPKACFSYIWVSRKPFRVGTI